jgi:hypothetical protein
MAVLAFAQRVDAPLLCILELIVYTDLSFSVILFNKFLYGALDLRMCDPGADAYIQ